MTSHNTHSTISRQWVLLSLLPAQYPGITARELQERLEREGFVVSKRQVERDLVDLCSLFPLECMNRNRPYGWKWRSKAQVNLPGISPCEALSWHLVGETLEQLLPTEVLSVLRPRLELARKMLEALPRNGNRVAGWQDKVRIAPPNFALCPPKVDAAVLEVIEQGLLGDQQIRVKYAPVSTRVVRTYELHPLGLVLRHNVMYLVAIHKDYPDPYLYALHRMHQADLLREPARRPADFDLDTYIDQGRMGFGLGKMLEVRIQVHEDLRALLQETPMTQHDQWEGHVLTTQVADNWQLRWWIMSQGERAVVLYPADLRKELCENHARAYEAYRQLA